MIEFVIVFGIWALAHSLTASRRVKGWVRGLVGDAVYDGWYRLIYNVVALVTFVPVLWVLATAVPTRTLWTLPAPFSWLGLILQLVGLVGLTIALFQTDITSCIGVRQALDYLQGENGDAERPSALVTSGPYALVRHPLYFFSLLILWFNPLMTLSGFILNVLATVYFGVGSKYEERRLEDEFGEAYTTYKQEVPYLLPWPRP